MDALGWRALTLLQARAGRGEVVVWPEGSRAQNLLRDVRLEWREGKLFQLESLSDSSQAVAENDGVLVHLQWSAGGMEKRTAFNIQTDESGVRVFPTTFEAVTRSPRQGPKNATKRSKSHVPLFRQPPRSVLPRSATRNSNNLLSGTVAAAERCDTTLRCHGGPGMSSCTLWGFCAQTTRRPGWGCGSPARWLNATLNSASSWSSNRRSRR
eukprot:1184650-Prorocentrum_minimum.AAC.5